MLWPYFTKALLGFKKVDGSLTLGGYDASRFAPNNVNFLMASDISRDLVIGLQDITYSDSNVTNEKLLNKGILTFIDATVPHIWLPQDACTLFEDAFGITYNSTVNRYLVNSTLHNQLQSQNASVSFIIGNDVSGGETVTITLPYAAFDLQVGPPIVDTTQYYFPLRRAANSSQYTMGRTFLQEAYVSPIHRALEALTILDILPPITSILISLLHKMYGTRPHLHKSSALHPRTPRKHLQQ